MPDYNSLAKLNVLDSESLNDVKYYMSRALLPNKNQVGIVEYPYFGLGEEENLDKWKYPHFTYKINEYGFRIEDMQYKSDIGAFGCSYTFGQGLPLEMLWVTLLGQKLNQTIQNFGMPGASLMTVLDIFSIVTKHISIDKAVILLPAMSRIQVAKFNNKNELGLLNCIPGASGLHNQTFGLDEENLYKHLPEDEIVKQTKNAIYQAEYIAKQRNIEIFVSSWDNKTYSLLQKMRLSSMQLITQWSQSYGWTIQQEPINDKARDNRHPGPKHHSNFAEIILPFLSK